MTAEYDRVEFLVGADRMLETHISQILTCSNITVPSGVSSEEWVEGHLEKFRQMDFKKLSQVVDTKGAGWQIATLVRLARERLINGFSYMIDSDRLIFNVEPLTAGRLVRFQMTGDQIEKGPAPH